MGLEAIEATEVITAALCAEVFEAKYAEIRVPSGATSNLYGFMATCKPGDTITAPPASIGGHPERLHSSGLAFVSAGVNPHSTKAHFSIN